MKLIVLVLSLLLSNSLFAFPGNDTSNIFHDTITHYENYDKIPWLYEDRAFSYALNNLYVVEEDINNGYSIDREDARCLDIAIKVFNLLENNLFNESIQSGINGFYEEGIAYEYKSLVNNKETNLEMALSSFLHCYRYGDHKNELQTSAAKEIYRIYLWQGRHKEANQFLNYSNLKK